MAFGLAVLLNPFWLMKLSLFSMALIGPNDKKTASVTTTQRPLTMELESSTQ
jgi:hypothetical protein